MNLATLKLTLQTKLATFARSVKTVKIGYITEMMSGTENYDALLIIPPKATVSDLAAYDSKTWEIKWFLMRLDKDFDENKRIEAWDQLEVINKALVNSIKNDMPNMRIEGGVTIDYNSSGPEQILPAKVVWIECNFILKVSDC